MSETHPVIQAMMDEVRKTDLGPETPADEFCRGLLKAAIEGAPSHPDYGEIVYPELLEAAGISL